MGYKKKGVGCYGLDVLMCGDHAWIYAFETLKESWIFFFKTEEVGPFWEVKCDGVSLSGWQGFAEFGCDER